MDSLTLSVNVSMTIPEVRIAKIVDSSTYNMIGVSGYFDEKKYDLIIYRSFNDSEYFVLDTIESQSRHILFDYGSKTIYEYQDTLSNPSVKSYKFQLINKATKETGVLSKAFFNENNNYLAYTTIKDMLDHLLCQYNEKDYASLYKTNFRRVWVFLRESLSTVGYVPFDTVNEIIPNEIRTYRRTKGIFSYK
jgi:hypothetical protein